MTTQPRIKLAVKGQILYAKNQLKLTAPVNFGSVQELIDHLNDSQDEHLGAGHSESRFDEKYVNFLITNKIVVARQVDPITGEIREISGVNASTTPPVLGNTTGSKSRDAALEAEGGAVAYANAPHTSLGHNPANLTHKSLEELNGMALAEAESAMIDQGEFDSREKAIAFLSANFRAPQPQPNPNA